MLWEEVILGPYRMLKRDFSFLTNYGFKFAHKSKHNVRPGVVYTNQKSLITILFDYYEGKFEVSFHQDVNDLLGISMLPSNWENGLDKNYLKQLPIVKNYVVLFLQKVNQCD